MTDRPVTRREVAFIVALVPVYIGFALFGVIEACRSHDRFKFFGWVLFAALMTIGIPGSIGFARFVIQQRRCERATSTRGGR